MLVKKGFTLVELMIVIAIIGILAAIVYPTYTSHIIKSNRAGAQSELLSQAQHLAKFKMARGSFDGATLDNGAASKNYPQQGNAEYQLSLAISANNQTWEISATPVASGRQVGNGDVVLNSAGQKCWTKGGSCTPSATSTWDGR